VRTGAFLWSSRRRAEPNAQYLRFVARNTAVSPLDTEDSTTIRLLVVTLSTRPELSPHDLLQRQSGSGGTPTWLVVDIRSRRSFHRSHVPGSHHIPLARLVSGETPDADLVLIGENDQQTSTAIDRLHAQGYPRLIRHLAGGLEAWQAQGLPLEGALKETLLARIDRLPLMRFLREGPSPRIQRQQVRA
jgi:rhodanese-related sulfurtransferase